MKTRIALIAIAAIAIAGFAPQVASAASAPGSPVDIRMQILYSGGGQEGGTFTASSPLCSVGNWQLVWNPHEGYWVFTCSDGSGTFGVTWTGALTKWRANGGTGTYSNIDGGGPIDQASSCITGTTIPCELHLTGSVRL
jgi:hypothetical protein